MKHVLVILVFLSSLTIQAQKELENPNKYSNAEIIEMKKIMGVDLSADTQKRKERESLSNQKNQNNEVKIEKFDYEEVIPVNLTKAVLWINLKKWISSNFSSYKHVVDMEDKDAGILVVKWNSGVVNPYSRYWTAKYEATFQIDVRDNKYRIKIYNSSAYTKPANMDIKNMSTSSLNYAMKELETIVEICRSLQGTETWNLDNRYFQVMGLNSNYKPIMKAVKDSYMTFKDQILNSLKVSMTKIDDF